jgi:UDP-N-acetylglucosamine--N-acetylmuramyl-(pentapeptide) pyrophosphoryl-undecaprenol N-acetylglucosamine transferase
LERLSGVRAFGYPQGGHVYPAIAIADALGAAATVAGLAAPPEVHFAGTRQRMEWTAVPKAGYRIHAIPAVSLHRKLLSLHNLLLPFRCAPTTVARNPREAHNLHVST